MSRGKSKGSQFERDISRSLTVWLTGQAKPYAFWRSPASGGLATISELNQDLGGDIIGLTEEAKEICSIISIELKTGYPKTSFWQHFKNIKNFNIKVFWRQCVEDAERASKLPMLIYRKKGNKPIVGVDRMTASNLVVNGSFGLLMIGSILMRFPHDDGLPPVELFDMKDFFDVIKPMHIGMLKYG